MNLHIDYFLLKRKVNNNFYGIVMNKIKFLLKIVARYLVFNLI